MGQKELEEFSMEADSGRREGLNFPLDLAIRRSEFTRAGVMSGVAGVEARLLGPEQAGEADPLLGHMVAVS